MGAPLDLLRSLAATGVSKRSHPGKLRATTEEGSSAPDPSPPSPRARTSPRAAQRLALHGASR
jgi:hypothetical protein